MPQRRPLVLCVDDDPDIRDSMRAMLEAEGCAMAEAATAEDALRAAAIAAPDLIIVDLMMEEIDAGIQFVRELRASGAAPPVYLLSSAGDLLALSIDAASLGVVALLQKPLSQSTLRGILRQQRCLPEESPQKARS
jgi:CheY-like chemotaxis protein